MDIELKDRLLEMKAALAAEGVAITPRRGKLLEVLVASERHPNVNDIHQEVKRSFPGTSLATVYNTIELLKDTGQVLEIEFSGVANRYDGRRPKAHPHMICTQCEKIEDLNSVESDGSMDAVARETGYEVVSRRTDYYGLCPKCQGTN